MNYFFPRIFLSDSTNLATSQTHHVIQEDHPAQVVEVEETIEDDDEGYRTSPGSDTSPTSTSSPPPSKVAPKKNVQPQQQVVLPQTRPQTRNGGMRLRHAEGGQGPEHESNNLMWLLDFKLDFFNEGQEGHHPNMRGKNIQIDF